MQPVRKATLIASVVLPILAIVTVYLRFYARRARKLPLLADDWSVLLALVSLDMFRFVFGDWMLIRRNSFVRLSLAFLLAMGIYPEVLGLGLWS